MLLCKGPVGCLVTPQDCPRPKSENLDETFKSKPKSLNLKLLDYFWGLYRDNGKENGNYYLGFRVYNPYMPRTPNPKPCNSPPMKNSFLSLYAQVQGSGFKVQGFSL